MFLMETMMDANKLERICNICCFVNGVCLSSNGRAGRICFWWHDINVTHILFLLIISLLIYLTTTTIRVGVL